MKWISFLLFSAVALFVSACEMHSKEETQASVGEEEKPSESAESTPSETVKPVDETKPAEQKPAGAEGKKFWDPK